MSDFLEGDTLFLETSATLANGFAILAGEFGFLSVFDLERRVLAGDAAFLAGDAAFLTAAVAFLAGDVDFLAV